MNELRASVDAVLAEDPSTLTGPEVAGELVELRAQIDRLEAAFSARVALFDARADYADEGAANAAVWLRHRCKLTPGDASSRVRVARRLRDELEGTREALAAGDVTYQQARVIAEQGGRVADRLGEPGLVALKEAEPIFLTAARKLHPNDLGKVVRRWEHVVDADGFLSDHERRYERRFLNLSQGFGGMWHIDGMLDPESGATLHAALQPLATPAGKDDARNPGQRRLDALTDIARRVLDSGTLPQSGGEKPHLIVEVTLDTLEKRLGAPVAELAGTPIPAETARRLACDAGVTRMITGPSRSTSAARRAPSPRGCAARCATATKAAPGRAVTTRPNGPTAITSSTGSTTTAKPNWKTSPCSAADTTAWFTKAANRYRNRHSSGTSAPGPRSAATTTPSSTRGANHRLLRHDNGRSVGAWAGRAKSGCPSPGRGRVPWRARSGPRATRQGGRVR